VAGVRRQDARRGRWLLTLGGLLAVLVGIGQLAAPDEGAAAEGQARIDAPANGSSVTGKVEVRGRAVGSSPDAFDYYRVYMGAGDDPRLLRPVGRPVNDPVEQGLLETIDTTPNTPGAYIIVLRVFDKNGTYAESQVHVTVAAQATPTPFAFFEPLPTSAAYAGAASTLPQTAPAPMAVDTVDGSQPFQPYVVPDLPSRTTSQIPQITGPDNVFGPPTLEAMPNDPVQQDPALVDINLSTP
jgi:hypothetical protein